MTDNISRMAASIRNVRQRLPIGCRVKMTAYAASMFPRYKGKMGTVVGFAHETSPRVLWDGRRTDSSYAPWLIRRKAAP